MLSYIYIFFYIGIEIASAGSWWCSPSLGIWPGEGFYVPDPCELTFANTLLLSNAAISLGNAFISLEISCSLLIIFSLFSFIFVIGLCSYNLVFIIIFIYYQH